MKLKQWTFPFISLVSIQEFARTGLVVEENTQSEHVADGQPKIHVAVVLVLFHKEIRPEPTISIVIN